MLGSIIKYTCVAMVGVVAFTTTGFFMDGDVIEEAKLATANYAGTLGSIAPSERQEKIASYISVHREEWVSRLIFAASVKDLDAALAQWA